MSLMKLLAWNAVGPAAKPLLALCASCHDAYCVAWRSAGLHKLPC